MALLQTAPIRRAVRETLTGVLTSTRSVAPGYASDDLFTNSEKHTELARAMIRPTFDVSVQSVSLHEDTPSEVNNIRLYSVAVAVSVAYKLDSAVLSPNDFDTVKAQAEQDCDRFSRALGWPGALNATSLGAPTGLVSGLLRFAGASVVDDEPVEGLYQTRLDFTGVAVVNVDAP